MEKRLRQLLGKEVTNLQKLFGDASYRTYYRGTLKNNETFILMAMPAGKMSVSEEITDLKTAPKELPFINIQKFLQKKGLPVPKIQLFSEEDRWLLLEDLGDTKLFDVATTADEKEKISWYQKAIDLLIELQTKTKPEKECLAFQRTYHEKIYNWEFDHFWEYFLEARGFHPTANDKKLFEEVTRKITETLSKIPKSFTHRDYQSRNLMIHQNKIYIIDFQDALLGPKVYDVVCLLRDSYVDLTPHLDQLLKYYCDKSGEDFESFRKIFDLQTVQRKLKDSGRFVFIDKVKKNPNFLQSIPTSINYVKQSLERLPEYRDLFVMLQKYIKEWQ